MNVKITHVFHDVYMGFSHQSLSEILAEKIGNRDLKHGEVAVFLNKSMTACKIMGPGGAFIYHREPYGSHLTVEDLRRIPTAFGGARLGFTGNLEAGLIKRLESAFGKLDKRFKVVNS